MSEDSFWEIGGSPGLGICPSPRPGYQDDTCVCLSRSHLYFMPGAVPGTGRCSVNGVERRVGVSNEIGEDVGCSLRGPHSSDGSVDAKIVEFGSASHVYTFFFFFKEERKEGKGK